MECFLENLSDGTKHKILSGLRFGNEYYSKDGSISKYHCGFMIDAEELTVEDLASENKTWLKINPNRLIQLNHKDILKLGNVNFQINITADETILVRLSNKVRYKISDGEIFGRKQCSGEESISRKHSEFKIDKEDVFVTDLKSANHTWFFIPPKRPIPLEHDDVIKMGKTDFKIIIEGRLRSSNSFSFKEMIFKREYSCTTELGKFNPNPKTKKVDVEIEMDENTIKNTSATASPSTRRLPPKHNNENIEIERGQIFELEEDEDSEIKLDRAKKKRR